MKNLVVRILVAIVLIAGIVLGFVSGIDLNQTQIETLIILAIITGVSVLYCFIVGEITLNNSQMDKLWSILPIIYGWVIAIKGNMDLRLVIMASLITIWGVRLTTNFALKGAYSIKFWSGEEDYRWVVLRNNPMLKKRWRWALFDFFFISLFQNVLVLAICFPMVACMSSTESYGTVMDIVATVLVLGFIVYETIADSEQMKFQNKKWDMINEGKKLEELPYPYNIGFNTKGLWSVSRHPNYCAEQMTWVSLYLFTIGASVVKYGIFNWTIVGSLVLIFLFMGSSSFGEGVTASKYPLYADYQKKVFKYLPLRKYK